MNGMVRLGARLALTGSFIAAALWITGARVHSLDALAHTPTSIVLLLAARSLAHLALEGSTFAILLRGTASGGRQVLVAFLRSRAAYLFGAAPADGAFLSWVLSQAERKQQILRLSLVFALRILVGLVVVCTLISLSSSPSQLVHLQRWPGLSLAGLSLALIYLVLRIGLQPRIGTRSTRLLAGALLGGQLIEGTLTAAALLMSGFPISPGEAFAAALGAAAIRYAPIGVAGFGPADLGWAALFQRAGLGEEGIAFALVDGCSKLAANLLLGALAWSLPGRPHHRRDCVTTRGVARRTAAGPTSQAPYF
jgi:hypothetical protein